MQTTNSAEKRGWKFHAVTHMIACMHAGLVLSGGRQHHPDLAPSMVLERPKVLYNDLTRSFVMWMHIDDAEYAMACAGKHMQPSQNTFEKSLLWKFGIGGNLAAK